jgi:two-component system phosphate regulon response regulator PhoB
VTRILVVEDEAAIREMICFTLGRAGFELVEAVDAGQALARLAEGEFALALVDWMLPGRSGLELLAELKRAPATAKLPVIMLTARAEAGDKVAALDGGADDYVTKPFSPSELTARIRAVLRRSGAEADGGAESLALEGLVLALDHHRVEADGRRVELGPTEYRLLEFFLRNPDRAFTRAQLLDRVWGRDAVLEERTVDVHIRRLRVALAASGHDRLVQTVRGHGYRFSAREP